MHYAVLRQEKLLDVELGVSRVIIKTAKQACVMCVYKTNS